MAKGPQIDAKRVVLHCFSSTFLTQNYVSWLNDPDVVKYSEQRHLKHTLQSCSEYVSSYDNSPHYLWAITAKLKNTDFEHIGNISATVDVNNKVADIAILIGNKNYWGQGFGLEAWNAVTHFLLHELKLRKITAGTMSLNKGMLSIMEKSGMHIEGERKKQFLINGQIADLVLAAKFNS